MKLGTAIALGATQGVVEWLPVSSEAVLTLLLVRFLGTPGIEAVGVSVWLHLGTTVSAVVHFRDEFADLLRYVPTYVGRLHEEGLTGDPRRNVGTGVIAGALQGLAIIPGVSRLGSTVFALLFRDFDSEDAFELSFLTSVPAVLVANVGLELTGEVPIGPELLVAGLTAFVVGFYAIRYVLELAARIEVAYLCFVLAGLSFLPLLP